MDTTVLIDWKEYERKKAALTNLAPEEYQEAIKEIEYELLSKLSNRHKP